MNNASMFRDLYSRISRREFLRGLSFGMAGLMLPEKLISNLLPDKPGKDNNALLGRVVQAGYKLHKAPHVESDVIKEMEMDSVWRITGATVSENEVSVNRIWYALDGIGYAHSRWIQPVRNKFNRVETNIPEDGCLGEITVAFVDAYSNIEEKRSIVYRFYYGATFWVMKRLINKEGSIWYQLLDDRYYSVFFVPARSVRLVPSSELTAISPDIPPEDKKLVVDLSTQSLTAYEGDKVVFMSRISSGVLMKEGGYFTPRGSFRTTRKRPCRHMVNPPNEFGTGFDLPGVPWVSYFTSNGVAFHGTYWHNDFGVPHSHGCINMTPQAAKWVYRWTTPTVPSEHYFYSDITGTRVVVQ